MDVNNPILQVAGLNTAFMTAMDAWATNWRDAAKFIPSTNAKEGYGWLGDVPQMQKWESELVSQNFREFDYELKNERFGLQIDIEHDELADGKYGQYEAKMIQAGQNAKEYPAVLISELRINGLTGLSYDGSAFFSTTHVEGDSGTQSNLVTGTGDTDAQIVADFTTARALMMSYKTDKGKPFVRGASRLVAVCSPDMEIPLRRALMLQTVSAGGSNVVSGMVSAVEVDQRMTGKDWVLEDRAPDLKAYILQERQELTVRTTEAGTKTDVVGDMTIWVAKWRGNAGYGQWRHAVYINNA